MGPQHRINRSKRRSPGDGSLSKRKSDGLWVGSVEIPSLDGKRRQLRVFSKNRNEAIRKLKALKADVDAGRVAVGGNAIVEAATVDDVRRVVREELAAYHDGADGVPCERSGP